MLGVELLARLLEPAAGRAIGLVRDSRREHSVADGLAVEARLERGLQPGDPLLVLTGERADVALADEAPELEVVAAVDCGADHVGSLERRHVGVPLVDRLELEGRLVAGEVEVLLLIDLAEERLGLLAHGVELAAAGRSSGHGSVG